MRLANMRFLKPSFPRPRDSSMEFSCITRLRLTGRVIFRARPSTLRWVLPYSLATATTTIRPFLLPIPGRLARALPSLRVAAEDLGSCTAQETSTKQTPVSIWGRETIIFPKLQTGGCFALSTRRATFEGPFIVRTKELRARDLAWPTICWETGNPSFDQGSACITAASMVLSFSRSLETCRALPTSCSTMSP